MRDVLKHYGLSYTIKQGNPISWAKVKSDINRNRLFCIGFESSDNSHMITRFFSENYRELNGVKKIQRKKWILLVVFLLLIWLIVLLGYKYQDKSLLNHNDVKNEVFTEDFFEGLIQVQSVTSSSSISKWKDLKKMCNILAKLSLKKSKYESDVNYYGGYFYVLKYEKGQERRISLLGISDEKMLIYLDNSCYETDEVILPQIIELFEKANK